MNRICRNQRRKSAGVTHVILATALLVMSSSQTAAQDLDGLRIVVLEGEDSVNIVAQGTAVPTLVEVRDRNDLPVSGASVLFLLGEGGTATLNAGLSQVALTTNALGQAAVTVNPLATGAVNLSVSATFAGETATAAIVQTNFATAAQAAAAGAGATGGAGGGAGAGAGAGAGGAAAGGGGAGLGAGALAGIVGAGAAGAAVATQVGGDDPPPEPPASSPSAPPAPTLTPADGELAVRWSAPSDNGAPIDDYDVRYRPAGGAWSELPDAVKSAALSATITGLTNGTAYDVQVRAGNSAGDGPWSASATATPEASTTDIDRAVLVEFYRATNGPNWSINTNWNSDAPLGQWYGVVTDGAGRVVSLSLRNNNLAGEIPASLGDLTYLTLLVLQSNSLTGRIPTTLGNLRRLLSLFLNDNDLVGGIPASLGNLGELEDLVIGANRLSGAIPSALGNLVKLDFLSLAGNELTEEIPGSLGNLENLQVLEADDNQLTGSIPASLGNLASLEFLNFHTNRLTGEIPASLGNLRNLEVLSLARNQLTGRIPASLQGLVALENLNLGWNRLTGDVPPWLSSLTNLTSIQLWRNELSGEIPTTLGELTRLTRLELTENQLTGEIPKSLENLVDLEQLWLSQNQLTGEIPASLCRFEDSINPQQGDVNLPCANGGSSERDRAVLVEFYNATNGPNWRSQDGWNTDAPLDEWLGVTTNADGRVVEISIVTNNIAGEIPASLGDLTEVESLYFSENEFTGQIPASLGRLRNLGTLHLGGAQLTGEIPESLGELENLAGLFLQLNHLTGEIPASLSRITKPTAHVYLYGNNLSGEIPAAWCEDSNRYRINPQQGGSLLPCASNDVLSLAVTVVAADGQLTVSWTAQLEDETIIDDYDVRYRAAGVASDVWVDLGKGTKTAAGSAIIEGLTNGTMYEVQVRAVNSGVEGEWSEAVTGRPEAASSVSFGGARVTDQQYTQYVETERLVLPAATGGEGPLTYSLAPALPAGLVFDAVARAISGRPSVPAAAVTYTYTARDANPTAPSEASLTFGIAVDVSPEEDALRRDALAAQGRALLSSVTGVIGERFRPRSASGGADGMAGTPGGVLEMLGSMLGLGTGSSHGGVFNMGGGRGLAAADHGPGTLSAIGGVGPAGAAGPGGWPGRMMSVGSQASKGGLASGASASAWGRPDVLGVLGGGGAGPAGLGRPYGQAAGSLGLGDELGAMGPGSLGMGLGGAGGWTGGRSFAAALPGGGDGEGASRYTVWGAGDRQSFSGTPDYGRYSGDMRSLYVGADGRFAGDWLAGAAVGRSWGAADYAAASGGGSSGRLTTGLTSVYPYVRGAVSGGLEIWAIGGYGWGEARDVRGAEEGSEPGDLTMTMGAAGLRANVAETGGIAMAVVGGAGSLSLSTDGGGLTLAGLAAGVQQARLGVELSRAAGRVTPYVQVGGRYDGGDGQTGAGLELVAGLRVSTTRVDLEARGRWLSVHSADGYGEYGAMARLAVKSRPDGTGLRASLSPRWGAPDALAGGEDSLLGGANLSGLHAGPGWTPAAQAMSLDSELGYGWRPRRLSGILFPMTSYRHTGVGGVLTNVGLSYLPSEQAAGRDLRMQFTLGRERWVDQGAHYRLAVAVVSTF